MRQRGLAIAKKKPLPRFEMRAEFEAYFPHPHRDNSDVTLRFIVTVEGGHMDELVESAHYYAKLKMELLGLNPRGIERDGYEVFALKTKENVGIFPVVDRVPAMYGEDLTTDAGKKSLKAQIIVPEDRVEALELYDDATKYPTVIRSARSVIRKPDEVKAWIMVETMAGARFRFDKARSESLPKAGREIAPWLPMLEPINDAATALFVAQAGNAK